MSCLTSSTYTPTLNDTTTVLKPAPQTLITSTEAPALPSVNQTFRRGFIPQPTPSPNELGLFELINLPTPIHRATNPLHTNNDDSTSLSRFTVSVTFLSFLTFIYIVHLLRIFPAKYGIKYTKSILKKVGRWNLTDWGLVSRPGPRSRLA